MTNARRRRAIAILLVFSVALMLGFHEIDRLCRELGQGVAFFSLSDVSGPLALTHVTEWQGWSGTIGSPGPFIRLHLGFDVLYMVTYGWLGFLLIGATMPRVNRNMTAAGKFRAQQKVDAARKRACRLAFWLSFVLLIDVIEDDFLFRASFLVDRADKGVDSSMAWLIAVLATVKWAALVWFVIELVRTWKPEPHWADRAKALLRSLWVQRLTAFSVVVLIALTVLPLHPVLEQVPDVQRRWFEVSGAPHGLLAAFVLSAFAATFFIIGRKRAELYYEIDVRHAGSYRVPHTYPAAEDKPLQHWAGARYLLWVVPAAAVLFLGLAHWNDPGHFDRGPWTIFLLTFGVILAGSLVSEFVFLVASVWREAREAEQQLAAEEAYGGPVPGPPPPSAAQLFAADEKAKLGIKLMVRVGDVLAALIVIVPALGVARALYPELLLLMTTSPDLFGHEPAAAIAIAVRVGVLLLVIGIAYYFIKRAMQVTPPRLKTTGTEVVDRRDQQPRVGWLFGPASAAAPVSAAVPAAPPSTRFRRFIAPGMDVGTVGAGSWWLMAAVAIPSILFIIAACVAPITLGMIGGGIAVTIASFASWVTLVAILMLILRRRRPLALFEALKMKSDPIISLFLIMPILVSFLSPVPLLHAVATHPASAVALDRPSLQEAFNSWLVRTSRCEVAIGDTKIRPLALVAAEGGGIRAATWTVAGLSQIMDAGPCASNSVFLSSGVSGGSIGLIIAARPPSEDGTPATGESLRKAINDIANATALPTAMSGLLVTDGIASATGLRLANTESHGEWRDRAALIEQSWRDAAAVDAPGGVDGLIGDFGGTVTAPTGLLVLNSTEVRTSCRVVVSEVELGRGETGSTSDPDDEREPIAEPEPSAAPDPSASPDPTDGERNPEDDRITETSPLGDSTLANCGAGVQEPPLTVDLLDYFENCRQPYADSSTTAGATAGTKAVDWATAGLLSARFPVVTPSGTIESTTKGCPIPKMQLVDGGYAENSGLGLLADTAEELAAIVRSYNTTRRPEGAPLVVPYVIYLQNEPEKFSPTSAGINELLVPIAGGSSKEAEVAPSTWIQRILQGYKEVCDRATSGSSRCESDARVLDDLPTSERAVIVSADLEPSLNLPLGWGLSNASYGQMMEAAANEARFDCNHGKKERAESCLGQYLLLFLGAQARAE